MKKMNDLLLLLSRHTEKAHAFLNAGSIVSAVLTKPHLDLCQQGFSPEESLKRVRKAHALLMQVWIDLTRKIFAPGRERNCAP